MTDWNVFRDSFFDWFVKEPREFGSDPCEPSKLWLFDKFAHECVREGMRIEFLAMNTRNRSAIVKFWDSYVHCAVKRKWSPTPL